MDDVVISGTALRAPLPAHGPDELLSHAQTAIADATHRIARSAMRPAKTQIDGFLPGAASCAGSSSWVAQGRWC